VDGRLKFLEGEVHEGVRRKEEDRLRHGLCRSQAGHGQLEVEEEDDLWGPHVSE
jgi:hypothetical protein